MRESILKSLFRNYKKQEARIHELSYLFWECTLRCSLNCLHCGSDCRQETSIPDMPANDFLNVLKQIRKETNPFQVTVAITGGEPTLRKDLPDIGKKITGLGFRWGIVTNGLNYPGMHQELVRAGMGSITVSLDGMKNSHNWLRNHPGSFDRAIESIRLISAERRLKYDIVTCVNPHNIDELPYMYELLLSMDVKAWRFFTIAPIGRAKNNNDLLLDDSQLLRLMDFISEHRGKSSMDIKFSCEAFVGPYENQVREGFFYCRAGINIGSILADGSISACPNIDRAFVQGNIYESDFMDVWNHQFKQMRDRRWNRTEECNNCKDYKDCQGSGFHLRDKNGKLLQCHSKSIRQATSAIPR